MIEAIPLTTPDQLLRGADLAQREIYAEAESLHDMLSSFKRADLILGVIEPATDAIAAVGSIRLHGQMPTEAYVTNVATMPRYRRLGYASAVMAGLEAYALNHDFDHVSLVPLPGSVSFYECIGYKNIGHGGRTMRKQLSVSNLTKS